MEIKSTEISFLATSDVKINPNNRNVHSDDQIKRLTEIIKYQGFRSPLIISNRTGLLVSGHGRLLAAKKIGMKEVPVIWQDFDSDEQEYLAAISDNAISAWGELDLSGINSDIGNLGPDFEIDLLGIKDFAIEPAEKIEIPKEDMNKKFILQVTFPNEEELADIRDDLTSRGYLVKEM